LGAFQFLGATVLALRSDSWRHGFCPFGGQFVITHPIIETHPRDWVRFTF
jgi:hypothetical protein